MENFVRRSNDFFVRGLWDIDVSSLDRFRAFLIKSLRLLYIAIQAFFEGELTLRAMSLVYTTLLSIVPLLAFSFSVLKAFGVHNQAEPFLYNFLAPLGPKREEITRKIIEFIDNTNVSVLGSLGLATLIYTVISLVQKIEDALNYIWKIEKSRSFARRFSDYISVILIGPVVIFAAFGLTASVMSNTIVQKLLSIGPFGAVIYIAGKLLPYIFVCVLFTFIYILLPNTKVKFWSALFGGVVAGILWQTTGWIFASFVVSSTKYAKIYSGFAVIILFIIWVYLNWLILLVGAKVSFCHQNVKFLTLKREALQLSNRAKEKLAVLIMFLVGYNYYHDKYPWTLNSLMNRLRLSEEPIQNVLTVLKKKRLILETRDDPPAYLPARDIETIKLKELINSIRVGEGEAYSIEDRSPPVTEADSVIERIDNAIENALGEETIKNIVLSHREI